MTSVDLNDPVVAQLITSTVDRRVAELLARQAQTRYGVVESVNTSTLTVGVYVSGSATASPGFAYAPWMAPAVGDKVRVVMDPRGDRYVDEVYSDSAVANLGVGWATQAPRSNTGDFGYGYAGSISLAVGAGVVQPIHVEAPIRLDRIRFYNTDTATARSAEVRVYVERDSATVLDFVTGTNATLSWTPSAGANRDFIYGTPPVLAPGFYMVALRNTSGAQTLGVARSTATGTPPYTGGLGYLQGTMGALGSTLDVSGLNSQSQAILAIHAIGYALGRSWV